MKILTITGVGPGDPSLLPLAAVNAIQDSTVVSYPVSIKGGESLAEKIASKWISKDKKYRRNFAEFSIPSGAKV